MWKKLAGAALALALTTSVSLAQTNPGLTQGQKLTPAQWNNLFASKQDTLGYTPLNQAGGQMTGRLLTAAPNATNSGFNLIPGTTPPSPANGDLWVTASGFFARVNGVTIGPISGGSSASFAATLPVSLSFPSGVVTYACPTCGVTGSPLSQFAATTSAQLAGVLSDETGSGLAVFNNAPTLIAPVLGAATATSINKVTITAPATAATLTIADGKTLTANNTLTLTGTDGTSFAFPSSSDTVATLAATQSLTNKTLSGSTNVLGGVTMTLGSDATGDIYYRNSGGQLTRLAIGTASQVLAVSGGGIPTWVAGSSAGSVTAGTTTIAGTCSTGQNTYSNGGVFDCRNQSSSLTAGTGISFSGTTNVTINNTGVTSAAFQNGNGISITVGAGANPCTTTCSLTVSTSLSTASNALSGDVNLSNTANYFDGPSMAQGTTGTWFASGTVTLFSTTGDTIYCKLWDGTTVIDSGVEFTGGTSTNRTMSLSGFITTPAANVRISCRDITTTNGKIVFNASGNSTDSKVSGFRTQ